MYTYMKKALMVISLLALPSMNMVVKAMDNEDREVPHAIQRVPTFREQLKDVIFDLGSATKSGAQGIANGLSSLATSFIEKPFETTVTLGLFGLVTIAAATAVETTVQTEVQDCKCTCTEGLSPPKELYIGAQPDPNYCKNECINRYYQDYTCPALTKRSDLY